MSAFLDGLPWIPNLLVSGVATWYLKSMLEVTSGPRYHPITDAFFSGCESGSY